MARRRLRDVLAALAITAGVVSCGGSGDGTIGPESTSSAHPPATSVRRTTTSPTTASPASSTTVRRTTSTTRASTTTPLAPPWWSVEPPTLPAAVAAPGFEALDDVEGLCVEFVVDDRTQSPSVDARLSDAFGDLGLPVVDSGCDARLVVTLAAESFAVEYGGGLTCYLDKTVTGTATLIVGDRTLWTWAIDEWRSAPSMIRSNSYCPGPDDPVDVDAFWWRSLAPMFVAVYGDLGGALFVRAASYPIGAVPFADEWQRVEFATGTVLPTVLAEAAGESVLVDEHVEVVEGLIRYLDRTGIDPPAGTTVLVPALLRTAERLVYDFEKDRVWAVLGWITGAGFGDSWMAWEWYLAQ